MSKISLGMRIIALTAAMLAALAIGYAGHATSVGTVISASPWDQY
jgi:hypothetical protein